MKVKRKLRTLVLTGVVGAAIAYFLDPVQGRARRERVARRAEQRRNDLEHLSVTVERVVDSVTGDASDDTGPASDATAENPTAAAERDEPGDITPR